VTDILATTLDKRNMHPERVITYRDIHYHGNVTDVTDITQGSSLTVKDISTDTKFIALFRLVPSNSSYFVFHILIPQGLP